MFEIELFFVDGSTNKYLLDQADIDTFVKASIELYHEPGINPYNQNETTKIWKITSSKIRKMPAVWWSTPGLGRGKFRKGVELYEPEFIQKILWQTGFIAYHYALKQSILEQRFIANLEL